MSHTRARHFEFDPSHLICGFGQSADNLFITFGIFEELEALIPGYDGVITVSDDCMFWEDDDDDIND